MKNIRLISIYILLATMIFSCKKKASSSQDATSSTTSAATTPTTAPTPTVTPPKLYLAKYTNTNGYGGALEFKDGGVLILSGPSGETSGTYSMTSDTHAEITVGGYGGGDFTNNFASFINPQGTWNK